MVLCLFQINISKCLSQKYFLKKRKKVKIVYTQPQHNMLLQYEMLTFALCVEQDVLFKGEVSGVGEGLVRELGEPLLQVGLLLF